MARRKGHREERLRTRETHTRQKRAVNSGIGADARSEIFRENRLDFERSILRNHSEGIESNVHYMIPRWHRTKARTTSRLTCVPTLSARGKKKTARAGRTSVAHQGRYQKRVAEKGSKLFCNRLERYFGRCRRILSRSYAHVQQRT